MAFKMKGFKYPGKSPTKLMPVAMPVNAAGAMGLSGQKITTPTEGETKEQEKRRKKREAEKKKKKITELRTTKRTGGNFA